MNYPQVKVTMKKDRAATSLQMKAVPTLSHLARRLNHPGKNPPHPKKTSPRMKTRRGKRKARKVSSKSKIQTGCSKSRRKSLHWTKRLLLDLVVLNLNYLDANVKNLISNALKPIIRNFTLKEKRRKPEPEQIWPY